MPKMGSLFDDWRLQLTRCAISCSAPKPPWLRDKACSKPRMKMTMHDLYRPAIFGFLEICSWRSQTEIRLTRWARVTSEVAHIANMEYSPPSPYIWPPPEMAQPSRRRVPFLPHCRGASLHSVWWHLPTCNILRTDVHRNAEPHDLQVTSTLAECTDIFAYVRQGHALAPDRMVRGTSPSRPGNDCNLIQCNPTKAPQISLTAPDSNLTRHLPAQV